MIRYSLLYLVILIINCGPLLAQQGGTGFLISRDGYIVTCDRCAGEGDEVTVLANDGYSYEGEVVFRSFELDLACVKIEYSAEDCFDLGDSSGVEINDPVHVFGFPLSFSVGSAMSGSTGSLRGVDATGAGDRLRIDVSMEPGNIGGPVLNRDGNVVGVALSSNRVTGKTGRPLEMNFAVPSNRLATELQNLGIPFEKEGRRRTPQEIADLAELATVRIVSTSKRPRDPVRSDTDDVAALYQSVVEAGEEYVLLGNSETVEEEVAIYDDEVDYYNQGIKSFEEIREDLEGLRLKWPERYYTISSVDHVSLDTEKQIGSTTVRFRFALFKGGKFYKGIADTFLVFDLSSGQPKAIFVREHKRVKQRNDR